MNPSLPFTSSPDPTPSQNPLSLMMSQMSKYAMPSSTPLYHNAIKTIATSDDELLPDRPLLPPPPPPQGSGPGARTGRGPQGEELMWALGMGRAAMVSSRPCGHAGLSVLPEGPGSGGVMYGDRAPAGLVQGNQARSAGVVSPTSNDASLANWARAWVSWLLTKCLESLPSQLGQAPGGKALTPGTSLAGQWARTEFCTLPQPGARGS